MVKNCLKKFLIFKILIKYVLSLDSGYTTPSNLTSASVNTQESAISSTDSSGHSSSSASSTPTHGATPAASPNTTASAQILSANYAMGSPGQTNKQIYMSETLKSAQHQVQQNNSVPQSYTTMPRHFMNQRVQPVPTVQQVQQLQQVPTVPTVQQVQSNQQVSGTLGVNTLQQPQNQVSSPVQVQHPSAQMAYMGTTGGTLQKVKRVYL